MWFIIQIFIIAKYMMDNLLDLLIRGAVFLYGGALISLIPAL